MDTETEELISKVPHVTLVFWIIKIFATTLGETGGDALSMSLDLGYLISTGIFAIIFIAAVAVQIKAKKFHPGLYWLTIVATTTVGTTLADYSTRDLGIGYTGGSAILLTCVILSLLVWRWVTGSVSVETVSTPKVEMFYWVTIMFSQTLGTALGDWFADSLDLGYLVAAAVFGAGLLITYLALSIYGDFEGTAFLGRIHSDPSARSGRRRFPRQTSRSRRPEPQQVHCIGGIAVADRCIHLYISSKAGRNCALNSIH